MLAKVWAALPKPSHLFGLKESDAQRAFLNAFMDKAEDLRVINGTVRGVLQTDDKSGPVEFIFTRQHSYDDEIYMLDFAARRQGKGAFKKAFAQVSEIARDTGINIVTSTYSAKTPEDERVADAVLRRVGFDAPPLDEMAPLSCMLYSFSPPQNG